MALAAQDIGRLRAATEQDIFSPIDPSIWAGKLPPRRDWMVESCFIRGSVGMVNGDGGVGKSLLMQQLLTCAVMGRGFLGLSCQPGRGLFLSCEDDADELWRRQHDINRAMGLEMEDTAEAGLWIDPRVGRDNVLSRLCQDRKSPHYWTMQPTALFSRILEYCLTRGVTYVVIDTATQVFAGNQNDEQQVVQFINQLRRLAVAIQGLVLITKHPSMAGRALGTGESGSVSWNNSVRSRLYMHKDKARGLMIESKKSNYGPADLQLPIRWERGAYMLNQPEVAQPRGYRDD